MKQLNELSTTFAQTTALPIIAAVVLKALYTKGMQLQRPTSTPSHIDCAARIRAHKNCFSEFGFPDEGAMKAFAEVASIWLVDALQAVS